MPRTRWSRAVGRDPGDQLRRRDDEGAEREPVPALPDEDADGGGERHRDEGDREAGAGDADHDRRGQRAERADRGDDRGAPADGDRRSRSRRRRRRGRGRARARSASRPGWRRRSSRRGRRWRWRRGRGRPRCGRGARAARPRRGARARAIAAAMIVRVSSSSQPRLIAMPRKRTAPKRIAMPPIQARTLAAEDGLEVERGALAGARPAASATRALEPAPVLPDRRRRRSSGWRCGLRLHPPSSRRSRAVTSASSLSTCSSLDSVVIGSSSSG